MNEIDKIKAFWNEFDQIHNKMENYLSNSSFFFKSTKKGYKYKSECKRIKDGVIEFDDNNNLNKNQKKNVRNLIHSIESFSDSLDGKVLEIQEKRNKLRDILTGIALLASLVSLLPSLPLIFRFFRLLFE